MVPAAKEAMEARKASGSMQHTRPWKTSESEADWQKTCENFQEGSLW